MKRSLLFVLLILLTGFSQISYAQCPRPGNVSFYEQTSINRYFADGGCSVIQGDILIAGDIGEDPVTSLAPLAGITQVTGSITINSTLITSLQGLQNLISVNHLLLLDNVRLTSMSQLGNLTSLNYLSVTRCNSLTQFSIGQVTSLVSFYVVGANSVKNMSGLGGLVSIPNMWLHLQDMNGLENLNGLTGLTNLNGIWLQNCPAVTDISGLNGLTERLNNIYITDSPLLSACNIPPVCNFVKTRSSMGGGLTLIGNGSGCTEEAVTTNCQTSLPVTLVKFQGNAIEGNVSLKWSTAEEINSREFQVEHSTDLNEWKSIGSIRSNQNSYTERNYQFTHKTPGVRNYYRLKMVDADDSFAYSSIVHVMNDQVGNLVSVYPNPASDYILIDQKHAVNLSNIQVMSLSGKVLLQQNKPTGGRLEIKSLKSGSYIVKARFNDDSETTQRIVVGR